MDIQANWSSAITLKNGTMNEIIIDSVLPEQEGCYIFYKQHGNSVSIIYVGQATNLRKRIKTQLNNAR